MILRALYLAQPNPSFRGCPAGYTAGFASREALYRFAEQAGSELSPKFVGQAFRPTPRLEPYSFSSFGTP